MEQPSIEDRISAIMNPAEETPTDLEAEHAPAEHGEAPEATIEATQEEAATEEPEAPTEPSDDDAVEIHDLAGLAEYLQADVADLYNVAIPYTVDGERHEFTLGEIKDQLPEWKQTLAKRQEIETTYQRQIAAEQQASQMLEQQAQFVNTHLQLVEQSLLQDMQGIDWEGLQRNNPGEWARQSEMMRRKTEQLRKMRDDAAQALTQQHEALKQQRANTEQAVLEREQTALLRAIPEWRNDEIASAERPALVEYLRDTGYSQDEINSAYDHRALVLARKAMMYDKAKQSGDVAKKKVVKLAKKNLKPGASQGRGEAQQDRMRAVIKAHKANPKSIDAAAARIRQLTGG